jgi:hypothetical protein
MSEPTDPTPLTPDEVRADIERTRAELAQTVSALTERLDVKARARARADELARDPRTRTVTIGVAVAAALAVALIVWRSRR